MAKTMNILATTASIVEGHKILKHIAPISAHVVAGTNFFSDFFASFSDVFGGRSANYQKQLSSIYNQAIEELKQKAYEIGANCIIGLQVDLDEISGKGKSMFMVTALGSAVVIDITSTNKNFTKNEILIENINAENIRLLHKRKEIINLANTDKLNLDKEIWEFITKNQVFEVYGFIISKIKKAIASQTESLPALFDKTQSYIEALDDEQKSSLLYDSLINEDSEILSERLSQIISTHDLFDWTYIMKLIEHSDFRKQKLALKILTYDKSHYNKSDIEQIKVFIDIIKRNFPERGTHTSKKGLFSSKEKEKWLCECGVTNDLGNYCKGCFKDIYGFTSNEMSPYKIIPLLEEKISLISEFFK